MLLVQFMSKLHCTDIREVTDQSLGPEKRVVLSGWKLLQVTSKLSDIVITIFLCGDSIQHKDMHKELRVITVPQ